MSTTGSVLSQHLFEGMLPLNARPPASLIPSPYPIMREIRLGYRGVPMQGPPRVFQGLVSHLGNEGTLRGPLPRVG